MARFPTFASSMLFGLLSTSLASAANIDVRQATTLKYEISDFTASCKSESDICFYGIQIVTSDNPDFGIGCDASGTSDSGKLPAVDETKCGIYTISVAKLDDGGLVLTVNLDMKSYTGSFTISSDDLATTTSGKKTLQSYTGDTAFTIDIMNASSSASDSASNTTASTVIEPSSATSVSPTADSEPSTTDTTTSSRGTTASTLIEPLSATSVSPTAESKPSTTGTTPSSSASSSETNGATRMSAFAGVLFAAGLMAFVI